MDNEAIAYLSGLVTSRQRLIVELAKAEAVLFGVVQVVDSRLMGDEDPRIESARASCRRIRAEFDAMERLVDKTTPPGRIESWSAELLALHVDELRKLIVPAPISLQTIEPVVAGSVGIVLLPQIQARPQSALVQDVRASARRFRLWFAGQTSLVPQSLKLLALVVAYLAYFWIDTKLIIMTLPSVIWNPELTLRLFINRLFS
jgi:hypothetical protein